MTKKPAPKKPAPKKPATKKTAPKKPAPKKTAPKKTAPKKTAPKKTAKKKPAPKKPAPKKPAPKKTAPKKTATKKTAPKKTATKTPATSTTAAPTKEALALHRKAIRHNWDTGVLRLLRLLRDPHCDSGTALALYWLGSPGFYEQFATIKDCPTWARTGFVFLRDLEKRLLKRDFATADILFDPANDKTTISSTGHDWTARIGDDPIVRPIPAALKRPSR